MSVKPVLLHFKFDKFADLPSDVGQNVLSETQTDSNGNKWYISLCPGGDRNASKEGFIAVYLFCENKGAFMDVKFAIHVKDANGLVISEKELSKTYREKNKFGYGTKQLMERSKILEPQGQVLKDGSLCIDVSIQVKTPRNDLYQPTNDLSDRMLDLFETGERTDVSFNVGGEMISAHSLILHTNAPILANYIDRDKSDGEAVTITDTTADVFRIVLKHVYSGYDPEEEEVLELGQEIIDAANRYELVKLKMAAENVLVRECVVDKTNVADYILFADAQCCALLKEYALSFFVLHHREVLKSENSKRLRESGELLSEIILLMGGEEYEGAKTVTELRLELNDLDLDVDGSKETLISRLENANEEDEFEDESEEDEELDNEEDEEAED